VHSEIKMGTNVGRSIDAIKHLQGERHMAACFF
jgi:hypothetical protein